MAMKLLKILLLPIVLFLKKFRRSILTKEGGGTIFQG